jgi:hypothetical protein
MIKYEHVSIMGLSRHQRLQKAVELFHSTDLTVSAIALAVQLPESTTRHFLVDRGLRRVRPEPDPRRISRNGKKQKLVQFEMAERSRIEREQYNKQAKKMAELYVKHGVAVTFLSERFGIPSETVCKMMRTVGVRILAASRTGPQIANQ